MKTWKNFPQKLLISFYQIVLCAMQLKEFFEKRKRKKGKKRPKLTFVRFKNLNFQSIYVPVSGLPELYQLQRHHNVIQSLLGHLVTWIPNCNPYKKYSMQWFHFCSGHFLIDITWNFEDLEKNKKEKET